MLWANDLGLDVGTAKTTVYVRGQGIVCCEDSALALSSRTGDTVATGKNAVSLENAEGSDALVVRPVSNGEISDHRAAIELLKHVMVRGLGRKCLVGPNVVASVPPGASPVSRYILENTLRGAGARRVVMVNASLAAALGAGFGVTHRASRMIVDIGAGSTDIGVIGEGAVLLSRSLPFGGKDLDEAIRRHVRRKFGIAISTSSAEEIKIRVGSVMPDLQREPVSLDGVEVYGELFQNVSVPLDEVPDLLARHLALVAGEVRWLLEDLAPGQRDDIRATGVSLAGGTCHLRGVARLMTEKLQIPASVVPNPADAVASGVGVVLQNPGRLRVDGAQFYATDQ